MNPIKAAKLRHDFRKAGGQVTQCPPGEARGIHRTSWGRKTHQHEGIVHAAMTMTEHPIGEDGQPVPIRRKDPSLGTQTRALPRSETLALLGRMTAKP